MPQMTGLWLVCWVVSDVLLPSVSLTCSGCKCWLRAGPLLWRASCANGSIYSHSTLDVSSKVCACLSRIACQFGAYTLGRFRCDAFLFDTFSSRVIFISLVYAPDLQYVGAHTKHAYIGYDAPVGADRLPSGGVMNQSVPIALCIPPL